MASKVMVKIPVAPFTQVNKAKTGGGSEIVAIARQTEFSPRNGDSAGKGAESSRIAQLEQNIRFLQEQHQLMLNGLHQEIDSLRNRNRDLEFKLTFSSKNSSPSSPSSSSEDDSKQHKVYVSPKQPNVTPLQVEIMERELGELKIHLQEIESQNVYLSAIVDEQKKKLEKYERDRERERERSMQPDQEILRKLDDAETLIRRLRHENSELRRETAAAASHSSVYHQHDSSGSNGRGGAGGGNSALHYQGQRNNTVTASTANNHQSRGNSQRNNRGNYRSGGGGGNNWFPPLHSQSYWQQSGSSNVGRNMEKSSLQADGNSLPSLQSSGGNGSVSGQQHYQRRGNNNHYHHGNNGGEGRKYRGGNNRGGGSHKA